MPRSWASLSAASRQNALQLILDVVQVCAHAAADALHQAREVKGQDACCPDLLRVLQPAELKFPNLQHTTPSAEDGLSLSCTCCMPTHVQS